MPRPDKTYSPGRLDGVSTPSRGSSWTKYGSTETTTAHDGIATEITVDLTDGAEAAVQAGRVPSKYAERSFTAPLPPLPDDEVNPVQPERVTTTEWTSVRSVDGRTYRRHDELVTRTM